MAKQIEQDLYYFNWDRSNPYNTSPFIELRIEGKPYMFLVDTGCSISFIDKNVVNKELDLLVNVSEDRTAGIINLNGGSMEVNRSVTTDKLTFKNTKKKLSHKFYVADLFIETNNKDFTYQGIIGFDFILKHRLNFDFDGFKVIILQ